MEKDLVSILKEDLNQQQADWRVEVIAAELIERGVPEENIIFYPEGAFKRAVSKDIVDVQQDLDAQGEQVMLHTSREGLYDFLPEGLFHQPYNSKPFKTKQELIHEIKVHRQEEKEARKFFLPFENEFYHLRLRLEQQEKEAVHGFSKSNRLLFNHLYGEAGFLNNRQINSLLHILPIAHKIRGDYNLTVQCFEIVTGTKISLKESIIEKAHAEAFCQSRINQCMLGINSMLGETFDEPCALLNLRIGPVEKNEVKTYLPGGTNDKLLKLLIDFFIPASFQVNTEIIIQKNENDFFLKDEQKVSYLAYNSYI